MTPHPPAHIFPAVPREAKFRILTRQVGESGSDFTFEVEDEWLASQLEGCDVTPSGEPGSFRINISPTSPGYYARGTLDINLGATCVRCLRRASLHLAIPFKVLMTPGPPAPNEETVAEDGSLGVGHYQGEEIVLDSLVRESIVLALPMNPHCPDGCSIEDLYRDED